MTTPTRIHATCTPGDIHKLTVTEGSFYPVRLEVGDPLDPVSVVLLLDRDQAEYIADAINFVLIETDPDPESDPR